jgi:hypothetical protein
VGVRPEPVYKLNRSELNNGRAMKAVYTNSAGSKNNSHTHGRGRADLDEERAAVLICSRCCACDAISPLKQWQGRCIAAPPIEYKSFLGLKPY